MFVGFSEKPVGTASLAQVHHATLKDGRSVAVKVQHPYVKAYSDVDMKTIDVSFIPFHDFMKTNTVDSY